MAGALTEDQQLDIVRAGYEAWNARDIDRGLEFFHPDAEWYGPPHSPFAGPYRGHGEMRRFFTDMLSTLDDLQRTPIEFESVGDSLLVRVRSVARGVGSGIAIDVELTDLWTFRGDKVARYQVFDDPFSARDALRAK